MWQTVVNSISVSSKKAATSSGLLTLYFFRKFGSQTFKLICLKQAKPSVLLHPQLLLIKASITQSRTSSMISKGFMDGTEDGRADGEGTGAVEGRSDGRADGNMLGAGVAQSNSTRIPTAWPVAPPYCGRVEHALKRGITRVHMRPFADVGSSFAISKRTAEQLTRVIPPAGAGDVNAILCCHTIWFNIWTISTCVSSPIEIGGDCTITPR
jgi:hypothetical protein